MSYLRQQYLPFIPNAHRFCQDWTPVADNDVKRVSLNQQLTGNAPHPKFVTPPFIAAPSHALDSWRASDLGQHSHINQRSNVPDADSGYAFRDSPAYQRSFPVALPSQPGQAEQIQMQPLQPGIYKKSIVTQPINSLLGISMTPQLAQQSVQRGDGYMLFEDMLPSATIQQGSPSLPPPQGKMPQYYRKSAGGATAAKMPQYYRQQPQQQQQPQPQQQANAFPPGPYSVYDPRTTQGGGPGDANTWTYNRLLGRIDNDGYAYPVNAVRQPSPIFRSNIDTFDWAQSVGANGGAKPITDGDTLRNLAQDQWLNDTNEFRASLANSQMSKKNAEMVQRRILPIRTF